MARWASVFAVLLSLPSIVTGLQVDDLLHKAALRHIAPYAGFVKSPLQLFTFFDGDATRTNRLVGEGVFAWWTGPALRLSFFRPLSALTHWLDHALWTDAPWLMHVHSYLWVALAVWLATRLYRGVLGATWIAGLAAVMFAIHDAHAIPYSWIANRNALVAVTFGLATVIAHRRRAMLLAAVCLALALASGESALATLAFLVSHTIFLEEDAGRAKRLLWYAPPIALWIYLYRAHGFGTVGSALYIDPGADPLRFALTALERLPLLAVANVVAAPVDVAFILPPLPYRAVVVLCWGITLLLAWWLYPVVRDRSTARFFALATVLALVPSCATVPSGRLLMFATFGAMGLFAEAIAYGPRAPARVALAIRLWAAPILLVVGNFQMPIAGVLIDRFAASIPNDPGLVEQELILVTCFDATGSTYVALKRQLTGLPVPKHTHVMAVGDQEVSVARIDDRTLVVRPRDGFLADKLSRIFRGTPFAVGDKVVWVHATIEVVELTADRRPAAARFTFAEPLESPRYRWMKFEGPALVPFAPPAVGTSVVVRKGEPF